MLLLVNTVDDAFVDSVFGFNIDSYYYYPNFKRSFYDGRKDTIRWIGDDRRYPKRDFVVAYPLIGWNVRVKNPVSKVDTLALAIDYNYVVDEVSVDEDSAEYGEKLMADKHFPPCAISMKYGKGKLICCPSPLLFTNYGMLDDECREFAFRVLAQAGGCPVVRTESLLQAKGNSLKGTSPLTFFLNHPPLRWAIYTALFGILLYFIFTAPAATRHTCCQPAAESGIRVRETHWYALPPAARQHRTRKKEVYVLLRDFAPRDNGRHRQCVRG